MVTNVDVDSPQYRIWNDRFLCQMKYIDTMSVDYIKIFGTVTTFDPELDRKSHNEIVDRYLTIIKMIEYSTESIPVYIKKAEDSKTIYILIQQHLQNWKFELARSLRTDNAPIDELALMDAFAEKVYEHAKFYLDTALADGPFARNLKRDNKSVLNLLKPPEDKENKLDLVIYPKRESLSSVFGRGSTQFNRK